MTAYGDGVLAGLLRAAAIVPTVGSDSRVYTRQVPDIADRTPCIIVRALPGGEAFEATSDGSRQVPIQIDAYTADTGDAGRAAHGYARAALRALVVAARQGAVTADGHLLRVSAASGPYDASDQAGPTGVHRWQVTALAAFRKRF